MMNLFIYNEAATTCEKKVIVRLSDDQIINWYDSALDC